MLQEHLWTLLSSVRRGSFPDPGIRVEIYNALLASALYPHPLAPPPYTLIHQALQEGAKDPSESVRMLPIPPFNSPIKVSQSF